MNLKFDIEGALDLADQIPVALDGIATLVWAMSVFRKNGGNCEVAESADAFLRDALFDISDAISDYADRAIAKDKKERGEE